MKHVIQEQPSIEDQLRQKNAELEAEVARLRKTEAEYGRVEAAIIMADRDFDGDSEHVSAGARLIAAVNRLRVEADAAAQLRELAFRTCNVVEALMSSGLIVSALGKVLGGEDEDGAAPDTSKPDGSELAMIYRNWRGEIGLRRIGAAGMSIWHGSTEWHPEPQPLLRAFDLDKQAWRDFALEDCAFLFHDQGSNAEAGPGPDAGEEAPSCEASEASARQLRLALEAIAKARPRFDYVVAGAGGIDMSQPGSPYDRGKAAAYQELQAVARGALKYS